MKVVFRRRPFWWRLTLLGLVTAGLLYALNAPIHISMELPARAGAHYSDARVHTASSVTNYAVGGLRIAVNAVIVAIAGAIAWIMLHRRRKAQAQLRDAFQ